MGDGKSCTNSVKKIPMDDFECGIKAALNLWVVFGYKKKADRLSLKHDGFGLEVRMHEDGTSRVISTFSQDMYLPVIDVIQKIIDAWIDVVEGRNRVEKRLRIVIPGQEHFEVTYVVFIKEEDLFEAEIIFHSDLLG